MDKFYITTSIAYTNTSPHIGYLLELLQADVLARYHRQLGEKVWFLTGTDEHGKKNAAAAQTAGQTPQRFVDKISSQFKQLIKIYNISNDDFIRTSDQSRHWPAVFKLWQKLDQIGDLYKATYEGLYCVGHESFIKPSELVDGLCPLHQTKPETIKEENWFFKLTRYKEKLRELLTKSDIHILPENKISEVLKMLEDLEDISFSRPRTKDSWGIPIPNDPSAIFYVWPEALSNYLSAIGYSEETEQFKAYWPADIHLIGKDILKFHAIYWPAMLLSAGLALPKNIYVHGFVTVDGQKMSKTIGNVVDPFTLAEKYGVDPVRYYLLREIPSNEDGDFSYKKLEDRYNGDLANNLGNLVSRVTKLIETKLNSELIFEEKFLDKEVKAKIAIAQAAYEKYVAEFKLHEALGKVWELFTFANGYIDTNKPWADNDPAHLLQTLTGSVALLATGVKLFCPFLPETAEKIYQSFGQTLDSQDQVFRVTQTAPLFPRLN